MGTFLPLSQSGGLPPRRDVVVQAASAPSSPMPSGFGDSINVSRARDRMLEFFEREQLPGDVKSTLAAALNGDLHLQHVLFVAMMDSWPKLQKNVNEMARLVSIAPWKVVPYSLRGKKPKPEAETAAGEVEEIIWNMKPRPERGENGFEGTVKALAMGYYFGHAVEEIRWEQKGGLWKPRATKPLGARYFGYPYELVPEGDPEDRLMLDPEGGLGARNLIDFPEHRLLIGINKGHPGHPAVAAPLRSLAAYWLAAVYGLKWFMNFTQLFGIPWRHAEVADPKDENAVKAALARIGSEGYIVTRPGTKINILDSKQTGQSLPQRELIDLADRQCDIFVLGQTLTSGTDSSGSRALGEVHQDTKAENVDAVADFVGEILTHQLVPAVMVVNWGEDQEEMPQIWAKREEAKDEKAAAERMEIVTRIGVPVTKQFVYEDLGIPMPADGDELFEPMKATEPTEDVPGGEKPKKPPVAAADAGTTWKQFPADSGTLGIPRAEMPQIASGNRSAMVSFLRARGIESRRETIAAGKLKPTQAEYSPEKVEGAMNYRGGNRAILISDDDHVVDGHHQWLAAVKKGETVEAIRLLVPISRVLIMAHRMPSTRVAATAVDEAPLTVDQLSTAVLEGLTGVSREWLSPVRPFFERLAALAMSKHVTDEDFLAGLEKARKELPELFELMDARGLQEAFEAAMGSAALAGSVGRYE